MLHATDEELLAECEVCGTTISVMDTSWNGVEPEAELADSDTNADDWYIHIHRLDTDPGDDGHGYGISTEDTYAFCPEHLPATAFPTAGDDPSFDIEGAVTAVQARYRDDAREA